MTEEKTKTCIGCGKDKPLSHFHRKATKLDGRAARCRPCMRSYLDKRPANQSDKPAREAKDDIEVRKRNILAAIAAESHKPGSGWVSYRRVIRAAIGDGGNMAEEAASLQIAGLVEINEFSGDRGHLIILTREGWEEVGQKPPFWITPPAAPLVSIRQRAQR